MMLGEKLKSSLFSKHNAKPRPMETAAGCARDVPIFVPLKIRGAESMDGADDLSGITPQNMHFFC